MDKNFEFQCEKCGLTYPKDFENGNGICDFCEEEIQEEIDEFFLIECDKCGEVFDIDQMYYIEEDEEDICANCLGN